MQGLGVDDIAKVPDQTHIMVPSNDSIVQLNEIESYKYLCVDFKRTYIFVRWGNPFIQFIVLSKDFNFPHEVKSPAWMSTSPSGTGKV